MKRKPCREVYLARIFDREDDLTGETLRVGVDPALRSSGLSDGVRSGAGLRETGEERTTALRNPQASMALNSELRDQGTKSGGDGLCVTPSPPLRWLPHAS